MNYIEFIPAELNEIISQRGLDWPSHLPMAASGGEYRTLDQILEFNGLKESDVPLDDIFDVLVKGRPLTDFSRLARRKYLDRWTLLKKEDKDMVVAFSGSPNITVSWFDTESQFWNSFLKDMNSFEVPELDSDELLTFSETEFFLLLGICDTFLRLNPMPDLDWEPLNPIVFSIKSLREDIKNPNGWYSGWSQLKNLQNPDDEELEAVALMLCEERKLIPVDTVDGSSTFELGREFTWIIRLMAWWDKGIILKKEDLQIFVIQSSFLWLFVNEADYWEIKAISGKELFKLVELICDTEIDADLKLEDENISAAAFCHKCGKTRMPEDVFCRYCGTKLD